jgi:trk system potassium uptake protein TrkH
MKYQVIGFTIGTILLILGVAQLLPALLDFYDGHRNAQIFYFCGVVSIFFGGALLLANKGFQMHMGVRQAFLLTTLIYILMATFSALPILLCNPHINYSQAFFEAMSGLSTTGSSILVGLDSMSRGLLLWRTLLTFFGGIGIVGLAAVLLPHLKVGGQQLFKTETSDQSDKPAGRIKDTIAMLTYVYLILDGACILAFKLLGMSWFDAVNHALPLIATAGFSTHDTSFAYFNSSAIEATASVFMVLSALPFIVYVKMLFRGRCDFFRDEQVIGFLSMVLLFVSILTLWLWLNSDYSIYTSLRYVSFNVISIMTTSGFASTDYVKWGSFANLYFLFLTYLGGCAGSTSGGIKVMRLIIAGRVFKNHLKNLLYPHGVFIALYQGRPVSPALGLNIMGFLGLYVAANALITIAITMTGVDFLSAVSGTATAMSGTGPGVGPIIGPAGNYATINSTALWLLDLAMLLGRLEILTVAVIFSMRFWKS